MKITIEATPNEVKELLQAIGSSQEHHNLLTKIDSLEAKITHLKSK